jgi:ATP adenylyltransferase
VTPLELLWNGWRATYVSSLGARPKPSAGSIFSAILASGLPDDETHIVHRGRECFALLNAYPYTVGHLLVLPYREVADLEQLPAERWMVARYDALVADPKDSRRARADRKRRLVAQPPRG